jgi:hypothetical protein
MGGREEGERPGNAVRKRRGGDREIQKLGRWLKRESKNLLVREKRTELMAMSRGHGESETDVPSYSGR